MLQSIDSRRSNLNTDLTATAAQGDFAHGQRHDIGRGHVHSDFAAGTRTTNTPRVTGDFASGTHSSPRRTAVGDFATGMRAASPPVITDDPTTAGSALPIAA
jgi:hypothetical protein